MIRVELMARYESGLEAGQAAGGIARAMRIAFLLISRHDRYRLTPSKLIETPTP